MLRNKTAFPVLQFERGVPVRLRRERERRCRFRRSSCCSSPPVASRMSPDEDALLLRLIYEHLKLHGHENAAKVLEEDVKQVRICSDNVLWRFK